MSAAEQLDVISPVDPALRRRAHEALKTARALQVSHAGAIDEGRWLGAEEVLRREMRRAFPDVQDRALVFHRRATPHQVYVEWDGGIVGWVEQVPSYVGVRLQVAQRLGERRWAVAFLDGFPPGPMLVRLGMWLEAIESGTLDHVPTKTLPCCWLEASTVEDVITQWRALCDACLKPSHHV